MTGIIVVGAVVLCAYIYIKMTEKNESINKLKSENDRYKSEEMRRNNNFISEVAFYRLKKEGAAYTLIQKENIDFVDGVDIIFKILDEKLQFSYQVLFENTFLEAIEKKYKYQYIKKAYFIEDFGSMFKLGSSNQTASIIKMDGVRVFLLYTGNMGYKGCINPVSFVLDNESKIDYLKKVLSEKNVQVIKGDINIINENNILTKCFLDENNQIYKW